MSSDFSYKITWGHMFNQMIMPNGDLSGLDTQKTKRNNNVLVYGGSGAGKTRSVVTPNLLAAIGSYIVADTKGNLYRQWSKYFYKRGYVVRHLNFIHPDRSDCFNPLNYVCSPNDAQKLAHQIVYAGYKEGRTCDPFWDQSVELLFSAIIGYFYEMMTCGEHFNFSEISRMISKINPDRWESGWPCEFDTTFQSGKQKYEDVNQEESWAYRQYLKFIATPKKTMGTIMLTAQTILAPFDTAEICNMMSRDDINLTSIGEKPTIVFVEVSDTDRSKDTLANIFYSQAMNQLCSYADERCRHSRLPVPVRFILDDFGTNCKIDGFENMISNIRSREISAMVILQSNGQLVSGYGENAHTIIDNCDSIFYMGGNDISTAQMIATRCDKPLKRILNMPIGTNWIIQRGEMPKFSETVDLGRYYIGGVPEITEHSF